MPRYKSWDDHSARWKREHTKAGESRALWNRWLGLTPASRKGTSPRDYAKGVDIRSQKLSSKRKAVATKISSGIAGKHAIIVSGVNLMTADELRWTERATREQIAARAREQISKDPNYKYKYIRNGVNPWWYKGNS